MESAVTDEMIALIERIQPEHVCLVPERRQEVTTEGGLDVVGNLAAVRTCVEALVSAGIKVSLFIDPDLHQIEASAQLKAEYVELHTGAWARAYYGSARGVELARLAPAVAFRRGLAAHGAEHGAHAVALPAQVIARIERLADAGLPGLQGGHAAVDRGAGADSALLFLGPAGDPGHVDADLQG